MKNQITGEQVAGSSKNGLGAVITRDVITRRFESANGLGNENQRESSEGTQCEHNYLLGDDGDTSAEVV